MSRTEDIKDFFKNHQDKFILTIGFILVCAISFAAGRLSLTSKSEPIKIEEGDIAEDNVDTKKGEENKEEDKENLTEDNKDQVDKTEKNEGVFVGDIESNKFYPFNSEEVGDIPQDNRIWFDSQEEAEEQGYTLVKKTDTSAAKSEKTSQDSEKDTKSDSATQGKYVGSKNSDKYHLPDSGPAKRIKEENQVWFQSKEEAESKGYTAGSGVSKTEEE